MVTHDGCVVAVKMTVKETTGPKEPNPVYSIETLDIQNPPSVLSRVNPDGTGIHPQAGFNANVLQRMDEVKSAVSETGNAELLKGLDIWLRDVAIGEMAVRGALEKVLRFARTNFTAAVLTWKPTSALLQLTGVFQTAAVIGSEYTLHGVKAFLAHPRQMWGYVTEHSPFMAGRAQAHVEAVQQVINARDGRFKAAHGAMIRYGYWMIAQVQRLVDIVTWLAAEKKGMALFDGDVARAQGSGEWMDKNALQRGSYGDKIRQSEVIKATQGCRGFGVGSGG